MVPALTGFLSCPFLQPQECILFYHPVCEHLHTVIVLLSSKLGECLQDTVLTPHPLSGDVFACCLSPALSYPNLDSHWYTFPSYCTVEASYTQFYLIFFKGICEHLKFVELSGGESGLVLLCQTSIVKAK